MKKILFIFTTFIISCNKNFNHDDVYRIIREKFPDDQFIEKSLEKAQQKPIAAENPFENEFFKDHEGALDRIINESSISLDLLTEIKLIEEEIYNLFYYQMKEKDDK